MTLKCHPGRPKAYPGSSRIELTELKATLGAFLLDPRFRGDDMGFISS